MFRALAIVGAAGCAMFAVWALSPPPEPTPPPQGYGDFAKRRCAVEAGPDTRSQKDCVFGYLMKRAIGERQ